MNMYIVQGIGLLALIAIVLSMQQKKRKHILYFLLAGQVLFLFHFALLGAWAGVASNAIAGARGLLFSKKKKFFSRKYLIGSILVFWIAMIILWEGPRTLLLIIGSTSESIALWLDKEKHVRKGMLIPRPFFGTYNFLVGSIGGVLTDSFLFVSTLIGMWRHDRKR